MQYLVLEALDIRLHYAEAWFWGLRCLIAGAFICILQFLYFPRSRRFRWKTRVGIQCSSWKGASSDLNVSLKSIGINGHLLSILRRYLLQINVWISMPYTWQIPIVRILLRHLSYPILHFLHRNVKIVSLSPIWRKLTWLLPPTSILWIQVSFDKSQLLWAKSRLYWRKIMIWIYLRLKYWLFGIHNFKD